MKIAEGEFYHFYNQGNNKEKIYFSRENHLFFLRKFRKYVFPCCKVLSYCLMPNHFHFLIYTTSESIKEQKVGPLMIPSITNGFRLLLSSYTQAINKQENRKGSLFRQKTKAKLLEYNISNYPFICFQYIHQNPMKAGCAKKMEDWEFSSFRDYLGLRNGTLCNQDLAFELLGFSKNRFYEESYEVIPAEIEENFL